MIFSFRVGYNSDANYGKITPFVTSVCYTYILERQMEIGMYNTFTFDYWIVRLNNSTIPSSEVPLVLFLLSYMYLAELSKYVLFNYVH